MNRFFYALIGAVWGAIGVLIIISPTFYSSYFNTKLNFTDIKWPFGGGLIVLGLFFIWSSFRKKTIEAARKAKDDKIILMCPECVKPYYKADCPELKCPKCQVPLEELLGFYERHPELKES